MKYHFKFHHEHLGYWAEGIELKGCRSQGSSLERLKKNLTTALHLYLEEPEHSRMVFPLPQKKITGRNVLSITVEPSLALAVCLRFWRLKKGLTQKEVAKQLGLKNLYSYQRLENSKTANPELATLVKLKDVFPELSIDELIAA